MSPIFVGGRTIYGALSSQPTGITTTAGSEYYDTTDNQKYIYIFLVHRNFLIIGC